MNNRTSLEKCMESDNQLLDPLQYDTNYTQKILIWLTLFMTCSVTYSCHRFPT